MTALWLCLGSINISISDRLSNRSFNLLRYLSLYNLIKYGCSFEEPRRILLFFLILDWISHWCFLISTHAYLSLNIGFDLFLARSELSITTLLIDVFNSRSRDLR